MDCWRPLVAALAALTIPVVGLAQEPPPEPPQTQDVPAQPSGLGVITDPETGLSWTDRDNGDDVAWDRAGEYCEAMDVGGHDDWRLPTIDELELLFEPSSDAKHKVRLGITLSQCCVWAATVEQPGETAWFYFFNEGYRKPFDLTYPYNLRALCVRVDGE